jgi:hypothetical protein
MVQEKNYQDQQLSDAQVVLGTLDEQLSQTLLNETMAIGPAIAVSLETVCQSMGPKTVEAFFRVLFELEHHAFRIGSEGFVLLLPAVNNTPKNNLNLLVWEIG